MDSARQILRFSVPGTLFILSCVTCQFVLDLALRRSEAGVLSSASAGLTILVIGASIPIGFIVYQLYYVTYGPLRLFKMAPTLDRGRFILQRLDEAHFNWIESRYSGGLPAIPYLKACTYSSGDQLKCGELASLAVVESWSASIEWSGAQPSTVSGGRLDRRPVLKPWRMVEYRDVNLEPKEKRFFARVNRSWHFIYKKFVDRWFRLLYVDDCAAFDPHGPSACCHVEEVGYLERVPAVEYRTWKARKALGRAYSQQWHNNWNVVVAELVRFRGDPELATIQTEYTSLSDIYHSLGASRTAFFASWWTMLIYETAVHHAEFYAMPARSWLSAAILSLLLLGCFVLMHRARSSTERALLSKLALTMRMSFPNHCRDL